MSLAKDINKLLDNILDIKAEIRRIDLEITSEQTLKNVQTGEKMDKKEVLEFVQGQINQIKKDLNKITNNGKNVKDIFTNNYYVNDSMQDREIIAKEKESNNIAPKPSAKKSKANKKLANKIKIDKEAWKKLYWGKKKKDFDDELPF